MKRRDPIAKDVRTPKYRLRVAEAKKGEGSFKREKRVDELDEAELEDAQVVEEPST